MKTCIAAVLFFMTPLPTGSEFFLFPTSFHSDTQLLKPGMSDRYKEALELEPKKLSHIPLTTYAQVTGASHILAVASHQAEHTNCFWVGIRERGERVAANCMNALNLQWECGDACCMGGCRGTQEGRESVWAWHSAV